ncbi:MAG: hypothetical protein H0U53_09630 [Actinobacteria bacterium]|nr:hypothetical protein [Actinomycetota bacterium]
MKPIRYSAAVPDHEVTVAGSRFFLDFAFPEVKLGIECQSVRWHLGDEALRRDSARMRKLSLAAWMILPYCWDEVVFDPAGVRREIEDALRLRSATLFS